MRWLLLMTAFVLVACSGKTDQTAADTPQDSPAEVATSTPDTNTPGVDTASDQGAVADLTMTDPGSPEPDVEPTPEVVAEVAQETTPEPPADAGSDPGIDPGATQTGLPDLSTLDLNGTIPPVALAAPVFEALNYDNGQRTQADLMGKPTVMWFFPFANTPG